MSRWCFSPVICALLFVHVIRAGETEAPANKTDPLAEVIRAAIPGYDKLSRFEQADAIRQWAYESIDTAACEKCLISEEEHPLFRGTASENFARVFHDEGGYWCAGTAFLTAQAYQTMGFEAITYFCGTLDTQTHVTTLVMIDGKYYVEDAYFNITFVDSHTNPMPFDDVIHLLGSKKIVTIREGKAAEKDVHLDRPLDPKVLTNNWPFDLAHGETLKQQMGEHHWVYRGSPRLWMFEKVQWETNQKLFTWLKQEGWPQHMEFMLLYPIAVNDRGAYCPVGTDNPALKHVTDVTSAARAGQKDVAGAQGQ